jgi:hypothetical protein
MVCILFFKYGALFGLVLMLVAWVIYLAAAERSLAVVVIVAISMSLSSVEKYMSLYRSDPPTALFALKCSTPPRNCKTYPTLHEWQRELQPMYSIVKRTVME